MNDAPAGRSGARILPLAPLQHGILAATVRAPAPGNYLTQAVFELSRAPHPGRWAECWQHVTDRHEALRAAFIWDRQGEPVQVIAEAAQVPVAQHRLAHEDAFREWLDRDRQQGIALGAPPLHRHCLVRLDTAATRHVFTFHHILLDGWSVERLLQEVLDRYNAPGAVAVPAPDAAPSPARYLAWYRRQRDHAAAFWNTYLDGFDGPTPLPDDLGGERTGFQNAERVFHLDAALSGRLRSAAAATGSTLNAVLLAAWSALLARLSGRDRVVVGTVSAGRDIPVADAGAIIGLLMNSLPLRVDTDPSASIESLCRRIMGDVSTIARHGHLPLSRIAGACDAPPGTPLFETMLVYESMPAREAHYEGVAVASRRYIDRTDIPLGLLVQPLDAIELKFVFDNQRVDAHTVQRLATSLESGLAEIAGNGAGTVGGLRFGAPREAAAAATTRTRPRTIARIRQVCRMRPNAVAVSQGEVRWTYGALERGMRNAAAWLERHAPADAPVLLALPPSPDAVVVMLGALTAGRPYVYLDPDYPPAYQEQIVNRLGHRYGSALVRVSRSGDAAPPGTKPVDIDALLACDRPLCGPVPDRASPAYIVFTSGSSGRPKGVVVTHGNLDYSNDCRIEYYREPVTRYLMLSPLSFDSSVAGLYWTLATGGELVLTPGPVRTRLDRLAALVRDKQITHTLCLPSVYALMLDHAGEGDLDSLTTVIVAGEACPPALIDRHRAGNRGALYNEYGPSEATVWCSVARLDTEPAPGEVCIGTAIDGTVLSIVNPRGETLPEGFSGELAVSGPGVCPGYVDEREPAAGRLVQREDGSRLYLTGDAAVQRDGLFYLRGRIDNQVKIRGVRIEPEHIEAHLNQHDQVERAAVLVGKGERLCAYVQMQGDGGSAGAMREWLRARLPDAMVPPRIVIRRELPTLPNGKLDRRALERLEPGEAGEPVLGDVNAPASIRVLMGRITGNAAAHDDQSFFDIGGDSLSAVRLMEQINHELGSGLNIADIYEHPTPRGLADLVNRRSRREDWLAVTPIRSGRDRPLFFAYGNARKLAAVLPEELPLYWVVHGRRGVVYPTADIHELAGSHLDRIREIQPRGPYRLAGFSLGALISMAVARSLRDAGHEVSLLALIDPTSPQPFLIRSRLRRLRAYLDGSFAARDKADYLLELSRRAPGIIYTRLIQTEAPAAPAQVPAGVTLQEGGGISREEILNQVQAVLSRHDFGKCPGHAVVMRPRPAGRPSLEWRDENGYWDSLFGGPVEHLSYRTAGRHVDLFSDPDALQRIGRWLTERLR